MADMLKTQKGLEELENILIARQEICPRDQLQYWIELQENLADAISLLKEQQHDLRVMFNRCESLTGKSACEFCGLRKKCKERS